MQPRGTWPPGWGACKPGRPRSSGAGGAYIHVGGRGGWKDACHTCRTASPPRHCPLALTCQGRIHPASRRWHQYPLPHLCPLSPYPLPLAVSPSPPSLPSPALPASSPCALLAFSPCCRRPSPPPPPSPWLPPPPRLCPPRPAPGQASPPPLRMPSAGVPPPWPAAGGWPGGQHPRGGAPRRCG